MPPTCFLSRVVWAEQILINTLLQQGEKCPSEAGNRFNGFPSPTETVKTVSRRTWFPITPLKQGVNERRPPTIPPQWSRQDALLLFLVHGFTETLFPSAGDWMNCSLPALLTGDPNTGSPTVNVVPIPSLLSKEIFP